MTTEVKVSELTEEQVLLLIDLIKFKEEQRVDFNTLEELRPLLLEQVDQLLIATKVPKSALEKVLALSRKLQSGALLSWNEVLELSRLWHLYYEEGGLKNKH